MSEKETNAAILTELRSIKGMVRNQGKMLKEHDIRLRDIEDQNKIAKAVVAGVDAYKKSEQDAVLYGSKMKLLRDLAPLIVAATALLYAIMTRLR